MYLCAIIFVHCFNVYCLTFAKHFSINSQAASRGQRQTLIQLMLCFRVQHFPLVLDLLYQFVK